MTFEEYREKFGIRLTCQQEKAVLRTDGNTLLLAVPGSGKTTVIVSRLGYMINCLGIPYHSVLTLTYSVAACRDMRERYTAMFGDGNVPQFRTIHGICAIIIKEYERVKGTQAFELVGSEESENGLLMKAYLDVTGQYPEPGCINELKRVMTYIRNMMLDVNRASDTVDVPYDICAVMELYRSEKRKRRIMDYDDQLEFAYRILVRYPEILESFRKRYRYINVDEAQDTSKLQHEIIGLLSSGNLFMVGDEDQSIYGFRAAYPQALLDFREKYENAQVLLMEQNFRSTANIVKRASKLISNNRNRYVKRMFTENADGDDIEIMNLASRRDMCEKICSAAKEICCANETGVVLFRNNDSAVPLIVRLEKQGIPYRYRETDCPFFENPCVCDILALLDTVYTNSRESFSYVAKRLGCGFSEDEIISMVRSPAEVPVYDIMRSAVSPEDERSKRVYALCAAMARAAGMKPADAVQLLCDSTCFGHFLEFRMKDIRIKNGILSDITSDCINYRDFKSRLDLLKKITADGKNPCGNCIVLSTVHSSKGLEYDRVFVVDVKDGEFPCVENPERCDGTERDCLEEERRLFYVAVTRARKKVTVMRYALEFDSSVCRKSTFINELMRYDASVISCVKKPDGASVKCMPESFSEGTRVIHRVYGEGCVVSVGNDKCSIEFTDGNIRQLSLRVALDAGVLWIKE